MSQAVLKPNETALRTPAPVPVPSTITPPSKPLNRIAFFARFVRNPLLVVPQAVYEQDFVRLGGSTPVAWVTEPDLIKAMLLDQRDKFRSSRKSASSVPCSARASSPARAQTGSGSASRPRRCSGTRS